MPEPTRVVVVNATPIIALVLIEQLDLLPRLYGVRSSFHWQFGPK